MEQQPDKSFKSKALLTLSSAKQWKIKMKSPLKKERNKEHN